MASKGRKRACAYNAGALEALRLRRLEKRPPTEADVPPPSTLPGPKHKPLKGQLDVYGGEVE